MSNDQQRQATNVEHQRILHVDDCDLTRQMLDEYLVIFGYQVLSLANGSGFFQALTDFQPHLILLDLKLPDIDGYSLLQQIQQRADWRRIPTIVLCGLCYKADRERALRLGARMYLIKPVNPATLNQAIQDELRNSVA